MKKLLLIIFSLVLLVGCATSKNEVVEENTKEETTTEEVVEEETTEEEAAEEETKEEVVEEEAKEVASMKILSPQGAPALSLIPVVNEGIHSVNTVEGADVISAELSQVDPNYDVIVAPTNLGVKLAATGNSDYLLYAIVDFGNLYLVGNLNVYNMPITSTGEETIPDKIAAFGENAVPGLVYKKVYERLLANTTFYNDVSEAREMLLSGNADVALLAEPAATATIAAAKQNGQDFKILSNVQEEWGDDGFPMAGLFVHKDYYEANKEAIETLVNQMKEYNEAVDMNDTTKLVEDINNGGIELYGVPNAEIIGKCYDRINIDIKKASECKDDISEFLGLFGVNDVSGAILE